MLRNERGFTLIEIVAVLLIIGILAVVAVPRFQDIKGEADKAACLQAVSQLNSNIAMLWAKNKLSNAASDYAGYTESNLGDDFALTGQADDTPGTGTITGKAGVGYTLTWSGGVGGGPGNFKMGDAE